MWPFSLLNRAPKLVVYVAVLVLLQTIYALVMTSNIRNVRQQKEADNPANSSIRTATMVTVPGKNGLKYNTTHRDFIRLLDVICSHRNMALRVTWRRDCPCPPPKLSRWKLFFSIGVNHEVLCLCFVRHITEIISGIFVSLKDFSDPIDLCSCLILVIVFKLD